MLITYLDRADDILEFCRLLGTGIVQLHGDVDPDELRAIKEVEPRLSVIKSLVVGQHSMSGLLEIMSASTPYVDAYITDTFDPQTGATGATGKLHDWSISRDLVRQSQRPVILAGGLTPDNVREAIQVVRPAGVDSHTGLEDARGRKDKLKVQKFVAEATKGFLDLQSGSKVV